MKKGLIIFVLVCMCAAMVSAQQFEEGVRVAINRIAQKAGMISDVIIGDMTLFGTHDTTTGFSIYLGDEVERWLLTKNKTFNVVKNTQTRGDKKPEPGKGVISGTFRKAGNNVEVTLKLGSDTKSIASEKITFPLKELTDRGIELEPENIRETQEREKVFTDLEKGTKNRRQPANTQTVQDINIQATFNSENRTYMHRDELQITVLADRNCWFKVVHIYADNTMKTIYPNSADTDNYLRANVSREIFETAAYMLYDPYGTETILIIASNEQFAGIEREYNMALVPVNAQTVRSAVSGSRGGDLQDKSPITFSGKGEVRYNITIIKPNEEYEYPRPENMIETYQTFRDDIERQGGFFAGNETSGYFTLNNIRSSYRVPRDKPDTLQFASYNLDSYTGGPIANTSTRGRSDFNFSFALPQNIAQAVQSVRSGIEKDGGTFSGNEQQGNFKASGIAGQYHIADLVNVTITEKPALIPNSLIEKEVRNFFGK